MRCTSCGLASPPGMRFCGHCGTPLPGAAASAPPEAAQRRQVTVMICDLVGSTPIAERLDPEDFREIIWSCQRLWTNAIERFGGYTARFTGDGVMAYFGYPVAQEDGARRSVHAALEITRELRTLEAETRTAHGVDLQVRIGLHTGVVIAGRMGAGETREEHAIVGDTPHLAARLEAFAPPGAIVVSDATRELTEGYFDFESLGEHALKGIARPVAIHRVLRATGAVSRQDAAASGEPSVLVGRADELAALLAAWAGAREGSGTLARITGEAGIGKSRLVRALVEQIGSAAADVQTWQCSPYNGSTALYPVIRHLEARLELDRATSAAPQLAQLRRAAEGAGLEPGLAVPLLADMLLVPQPEGALDALGLSPQGLRTERLRVLEALLVRDAQRHPLLLIIEDLHWADPTTLELVARIRHGLTALPVLCLLVTRPAPAGAAQPAADLELALGPLAVAEVHAMADAAAGARLERRALEWLLSAADGIPLFVEEIVRMLARAGGHDALEAGRSTVPPTLQGMLTGRLDQLPELSAVIDLAAVLGRDFDRALLEALETLPAAELEAILGRLFQQDVLRPVPGAPSRIEFAHVLLQEAAYARLLRRRREALHEQVAETLIARFPEVVEREPEQVARHLSRAARHARAVPLWQEAGVRALERGAFIEASDHFRHGLVALETDAPVDEGLRVDFLTSMAASVQAGRGYADSSVKSVYARARAGCQRLGDDQRLAAIVRGEWLFHLLRGEYDPALERGAEMLTLGHRDEDPVWLAEGHLYQGFVQMYRAQFGPARTHFLEALNRYRPPRPGDQIYEAQGDTGVMAHAYLSYTLWTLGDPAGAAHHSAASLELAERISGPVTTSLAWGMRSILHFGRGEYAELARWVTMTLKHTEEMGVGYWYSFASLVSTWLRGRSGELQWAIDAMAREIDAYLASGSRLAVAHFHMLHADLRLETGDVAAAMDALGAGERYVAGSGERFSESELYRLKGRILMSGPGADPDAATAAFEHAAASAREQGAWLLELRALLRLAKHRRELGEPLTAVERLSQVCAAFAPGTSLPELDEARAMLAGVSRTPARDSHA